MMPELDGLELCRLIRTEYRAQYTYIVLLTALRGGASFLEGLDAGADDFITNPFDKEQLAARLRVAERSLALHDKLRLQALHDGLTGLPNRTSVMESLTHELDRCRRDAMPLGVVLLDLDHFKRVNDTYGFASGDVVLREAARRLKSAMRCYDKVGRYGGEEFLIIAPGCSQQNIVTLAERVRLCIGGEPVQTPEGALQMSCSLGAAVTFIGQEEAGDALIARADAALYRAKAGGRNRNELAMEAAETA